MPVALVHDWLTGMRGGEKVLEAIAAGFPDAPIHTLFHFPGSVSPALEGHPVVTSFLQRAPGVRRHYRRYLPFFPAAIEDFDLSGFDLVISTSHCVAKAAIPAPGARHLCYCHTPMRYAWDQEHAYFPRRRGVAARVRGLALSALRTWDVATVARVDLFVANSTFVAERIRRFYGREAVVLPPPVDTEFFTPGDGSGRAQEFALVVSALAPYKRVDLAVRSAARAGIDVVVVGDGPGVAALRRQAGRGVRLVGRLEGEALRELYRGATCLLQPGIEDFGIAPVEALACGTPVVAVGRGGVLDIVTDGIHGVLCEPGRDDEERVAALASAVDKARRFRFNLSELRSRAEDFSVVRFRDGFAAHLEGLAPGVRRAGFVSR